MFIIPFAVFPSCFPLCVPDVLPYLNPSRSCDLSEIVSCAVPSSVLVWPVPVHPDSWLLDNPWTILWPAVYDPGLDYRLRFSWISFPHRPCFGCLVTNSILWPLLLFGSPWLYLFARITTLCPDSVLRAVYPVILLSAGDRPLPVYFAILLTKRLLRNYSRLYLVPQTHHPDKFGILS